jgi:hypothetical protein
MTNVQTCQKSSNPVVLKFNLRSLDPIQADVIKIAKGMSLTILRINGDIHQVSITADATQLIDEISYIDQ